MKYVFAIAMILAASSAWACGSGAEPVEIMFVGQTVDLTGPNIVEGRHLPGGITVFDVSDDALQGNESSAKLVTLQAGDMLKTYRVAWPPLSRGTGCNQPYVAE